jgi:mono/diheme cytochrome c family protein
MSARAILLSAGRQALATAWPCGARRGAFSPGARTAAAVGAALLLACFQSALAQTGAIERGKAKFEHTCAPCHADGPGDDGRAMLPGTDALRIKYKGELPALIERRTDLDFKAIETFVRRGTWSMPPFRKTEVTDADLEDIAAYIASSAKKAAGARAPRSQ